LMHVDALAYLTGPLSPLAFIQHVSQDITT
jgi:hypothetical protein